MENLSNEQLAITAECVRAPSKHFQITGYQLTKLENKAKNFIVMTENFMHLTLFQQLFKGYEVIQYFVKVFEKTGMGF